MTSSTFPRQEYLIGSLQDASCSETISLFLKYRPNIKYLPNISSSSSNTLTWITSHDDVVLDSTELEVHYLSGKHKLSSMDIAKLWTTSCDDRLRLIEDHHTTSSHTANTMSRLGDGGKYQQELDTAISAVHRASYLTLYMQSRLQNVTEVISKSDDTPVTMADLATQALIIDQLATSFPDDHFIAEEDASMIRNNKKIRDSILRILHVVTGQLWTEERLYRTIDLGGALSTAGRVWVLDPIDGTKGFIRGEHYCIALALLEDGIPKVSVMGCPNLSLDRVLSKDKVEAITPGRYIIDNLYLTASSSGSIYFAVSNHGAYARSLSMPFRAAIEVQVSNNNRFPDVTICESAEASFGSRETTSIMKNNLGIQHDFLRLDGQCKLCLVGAGAAECNLRLPPKSYVEKIWDHAPGYHYICEAGGMVTDMDGKDLDFKQGRYLTANTAGIVASNGLLHQHIIDAVKQAENWIQYYKNNYYH